MNKCKYPRDYQICKKEHLTIIHREDETKKDDSQNELNVKALSSLSSKEMEGYNMSIVPVRIFVMVKSI